MVGSDRVPDPQRLAASPGWKAQTFNESEMALFSRVHAVSALQKSLTPPTLLEMRFFANRLSREIVYARFRGVLR